MSTAPPNLPDALLRQALARRAAGPSTSAELLVDVLAAVETLPQRRGWGLRPLASELRLVPILLLMAVLLSALIGLALFAGGRITPPQLSELVAYESDGDIYVGDPATGETTAIVTGPSFEARPIVSPDGTHIAFYRSAARLPEHDWVASTASILVVRTDGSDERVIVPAGISGQAFGGFSWTPESSSLVVNHNDVGEGWVGLLTLFDASGVDEPRLLTPPLPKAVGANHPQVGSEVAPMFRPPRGDRVLTGTEGGALIAMDIDGSNVMEILNPAQTDLPFEIIEGAVWSPDARWIAVTAGEPCRQPNSYGCLGWESQRIYVVSADGNEVRRLTRAPADVDPGRHILERAIAWSPDGSRILINRTTAEYLDVAALATETFPITGQTLVVDVATGVEGAITAPASGEFGPPYGPPPSGSESNGITWVPSLSSSWSPDGRSVLVFEGPGTRPLVIDVETGASTRLPWETDWHPSWRFVTTSDAR